MASKYFDQIEVTWKAKLWVKWYFFKQDIKAGRILFAFKMLIK